ncbi:hypothetical protein ABE52_05865, partial [Bacillus thuringiensis]|uniref:hypothetical protein n=1 Tax=Bacillus thuringiensis TaxID=1428 RepID=UPI0019D5BE71
KESEWNFVIVIFKRGALLSSQLWTVVAFMIWHQVYFKVKINLNAYDKNKKDVSYMTFFLFWIKKVCM